MNQDVCCSDVLTAAPRGLAQEAVIQWALDEGKAKTTDPSFIIAHCTGMSLGDPVELGALNPVYGPGPRSEEP